MPSKNCPLQGSPNLAAAIEYVSLGRKLVLLHEILADGSCSCGNRGGTCPASTGKDASGKHPRTRGWNKRLITDAAEAERLWTQHPAANIGMCPRDDEVVLDIDPRNGGAETFMNLATRLGELDGPCALTGGGGHHYWIRLPRGADVAKVTNRINRSLKLLGPGIDLRTCKNQVVVPPSVHKSGRTYQWVAGRSLRECALSVPRHGWLHALGILEQGQPSEPDQGPEPAKATGPIERGNDNDDLARAEWGLVHARLLDPDSGYHDWFRIGPALKGLGDDGLRLWIKASRPSKDFDEAEIRRKWPGLTGSSINALFGMFDDANPSWRQAYRDFTAKHGLPNHPTPVTDGLAPALPRQRPWPKPMAPEAFHGLAGDFVRLVENETEADRHALLLQLLVLYGNCIGRSPHLMIGAVRHGTNLFTTIAGDSSRGRKGTSEAECRRLMRFADDVWATNNICSGLSSGEGLIDVIRDPRDGPPDKNGKITVIPGVADKRCMVSEGEFARVLAQVSREGNVLSSILRQAWDSETLRTMVRGNPARATDPHVSLIAHVTQFELIARMSETDLMNGLGNRFLWCCSRRSKKLPFGGKVCQADLEQLAQQFKSALFHARKTTRLDYTIDARDYWAKAYEEISVDRPGLWGALTARAEAQVLRLAMLYALLDSMDQIHVVHLEAARAVWNYCDASVAYLFGDKLGNPTADKIHAAIKSAGPAGITRTKLSAALGRNVIAATIDSALELLVSAGLVTLEVVGEGKMRTEIWRVKS